MDFKTQKHLEEAKEHFYALRLVETYNILRRYFDRLPFEQEEAHAEYIGMFVRTLVELGKEYELKFYMAELERLYDKSKHPAIGYQLGVVYCFLSEPNMEKAKTLFESVIRSPAVKSYHAKARMMLARYYDEKGDIASCRELIESISTPDDFYMRTLTDVWKAKLRMDEGKFDDSARILYSVLAEVTLEKHWYGYFWAKTMLATLLIKNGELDKGKPILAELKYLFNHRRFRSLQIQLKDIESLLSTKRPQESIRVMPGDEGSSVIYDNKTLRFKPESTSEQLLLLLARKRFLDKTAIVKALYARQYKAQRDDKLIHYHIHSLRKRLMEVGLSSKVICSDGDGYRLVPEVVFPGGLA